MNLHKMTMPHEILVYEMFVNRMSNGHITLIAPVLLAESLRQVDQNSHISIVYTTKHK